MNLVIDIGNTQTKFAVFEGGAMHVDQTADRGTEAACIRELFGIFPKIRHCMIASVGQDPKEIRRLTALHADTRVLGPETALPFTNAYATPYTLGADRIALVAAAHARYPRRNALVIDMGTCVTYDLIDAGSVYRGGAIAPGLNMRYRALHEQTAALPLLAPEPIEAWVGNSTESSIHVGAFQGLACEVRGMIDAYRGRYEDLTVILTGGDSAIFGKLLKNGIFAHSKFLLEGLDHLLEFNKV